MNTQEFWDQESHEKNPILTDSMVHLAEMKLGVKLPALLIELLKIQNGGYTRGFGFPIAEKTTWAEDHVPLSDLLGIVDDDNVISILSTAYMTQEWDLPEKQVLLTGDGHWWITLDYRRGAVPSIRWIDVECNQDIHIANTFEEFIDGLLDEGKFA